MTLARSDASFFGNRSSDNKGALCFVFSPPLHNMGIRYFWSEESLTALQPLLAKLVLFVSLSSILETPAQSQKLFKSHILPMVLGLVLPCSSPAFVHTVFI